MDVKNIVVAPYSVGLLFSTVFSLFPRATSQAGMLTCIFGGCREGQIPCCSAAGALTGNEGKKRGKGLE